MRSEVAAYMAGNFDGAMFGLNSGEKLLSALCLRGSESDKRGCGSHYGAYFGIGSGKFVKVVGAARKTNRSVIHRSGRFNAFS